MGIPTLITTNTSSDAATSSFTSGITSSYDEYMFVFTDVNPATQAHSFSFQANAAGESGYNETMTTTLWRFEHDEGNTYANLGYMDEREQAEGTGFQELIQGPGSGADESLAGILHLFSPASTTYVKHFYSSITEYYHGDAAQNWNCAGYFNTTTAIDDIQFKMTSGNFDGVIQMYGIA